LRPRVTAGLPFRGAGTEHSPRSLRKRVEEDLRALTSRIDLSQPLLERCPTLPHLSAPHRRLAESRRAEWQIRQRGDSSTATSRRAVHRSACRLLLDQAPRRVRRSGWIGLDDCAPDGSAKGILGLLFVAISHRRTNRGFRGTRASHRETLRNRPFLKRPKPLPPGLVPDRRSQVHRAGCGLSKTSNRLLKGSRRGVAERVDL
jgi:hypothetical protein